MNEYPKLNKFLKRSKVGVGTCVVLTIIIAVLLVLAVMAKIDTDNASPMNFSKVESSGEYATIDVYVVSSWLMKYDDDYYIMAIDENFNYDVVIVDEDTYDELEDYRTYFETGNDEDIPLSMYTLTGVSQKMTTDELESVADVLDVETDEIEENFGLYLLDTTRTYSGYFGMWIAFAFMVGAFLFVIVSALLHESAMRKNNIEYLKSYGLLAKAEAEIGSANARTFQKGNIIFTENFIFSKQNQIVLMYKDALWCYKFVQKTNFITTIESLVVGGPNKVKYTLASYPRKDKNGEIEQMLTIIRSKNEKVILGFGNDERLMYEQECQKRNFV